MSAAFHGFLNQAVKDYEAALKAQGKVLSQAANNHLRGAKDFIHFLQTGKLLKRDQRAPKD